MPPLLGAFVQTLLEEGVGAPPRFLRAVQRKIGAAQEAAAILAILRSDGDADAGRRSEFIAIDDDGLGDRGEDVAGQPVDRVTVVADRLQHDELVAAEASDEMAARGVLDTSAGLDQQGVAGRVAECVVDDLELVEIEAMQSEQRAASGRGAEMMLELLLEHGAIGQAGQDVIEGQLSDALLALDDLADHFVEAVGEAREFVFAADADLDMLARRETAGGFVEARQGLCDSGGGFPGGQPDQQQAEQGHHAQGDLQLARVGHGLGPRVSEQQDCAVAA